MAYQDIGFEVVDHVAPITLKRPEHLNAFSGRMGIDLAAAYRECDGNDDIRAVVVTGAGRAFCAGADITADAFTHSHARGRGHGTAVACVTPATAAV